MDAEERRRELALDKAPGVLDMSAVAVASGEERSCLNRGHIPTWERTPQGGQTGSGPGDS